MRKRFFSLVILMSISLIGIIFVQVYWIQGAIQEKKEIFSLNVSQLLRSVSEKVSQKEATDFVTRLTRMMDSIPKPDIKQIPKLFIVKVDNESKERWYYSQELIQKDYGLLPIPGKKELDLINVEVKKFVSKRSLTKTQDFYNERKKYTKYTYSYEKIGNLRELDKALYYTAYKDLAEHMSVETRISKEELKEILITAVLDKNLLSKFEFSIYKDGVQTSISSEGFTISGDDVYSTPLFTDEKGVSPYRLYVSFPEQKKITMSSIGFVAVMSLVFTGVIIFVYAITLYHLITQKKLSTIKTDFINNMTHEFKTPIATISLALDAIKTPKVIENKELIKKYLKAIGEENKRMHAQVEGILRISKLEKKGRIKFDKEPVDINVIINTAISHMELMLQNKGGTLDLSLNAERYTVIGSASHLVDAIINLLDNAIKYSNGAPKIEIATEEVGNHIYISVKDSGIGMAKSSINKIFDKFYRETTGNIHNVKGHGLGLAYVSTVVKSHMGEITVQTERGKGSVFCIKLPLFNS